MLLTALLTLTASIEEPTLLQDVDAVAALCRDVTAKKDEEDRALFDRVFRVLVDPVSVRFGPYEDGALPLVVDRPLTALDGALSLAVMDRRGAAVTMLEPAAKAMTIKAEQKQIWLSVTFLLDDEMADELPPCHSNPQSAAYLVRAFPLVYELLDADENSLARVRTDRFEQSDVFSPKAAKVELTARVVSGVIDAAALTAAIEAKRAALEKCVETVTRSRADTGVVGLVAAVKGGKIQETRTELEAIQDPQAATCLAQALATVEAPRSAGNAEIGVVVSIRREAS